MNEKYKKQKKKKEKEGKLTVNSKLMVKLRKTKHIMKELLHLSKSESAILTRLRTEHISLNHYKNVVRTKSLHSTTSKCDCGHEKETVTHYLLHCKQFKKERIEMWDNICLIDEFFKKKCNRNINNLLFYFKKQEKAHLRSKIDIRVSIIKEILKFIINTKRFEKVVKDNNGNDKIEYDSIFYKNLSRKYKKKGYSVDVIDITSDSDESEEE